MGNQWDERFSTDEYVYGKEPNAFVVEAAKQLPQGKILCIAEGEGRNAVYLSTLDKHVTAWDFAKSGLEKTNRLAQEKGVQVTTELRDLSEVEWQAEQWDAIVHIFGHLPKPVMERTFAGVKKALKPGGYYISELYTKEQLHYGTGGPKNEDMLTDPKEMLAQFEGYLIQHFFVGEVDRQEGILHTGKAHIVQCLFQKREEA